MLEGSAAALTHWAGGKRTDRSASLTRWPPAAQDPAGQMLLLEKNAHKQVGNLRGSIKGRLITFVFMSFGKGFLTLSRAQDKSVDNNGEMGEKGEMGESGNGVDFWDLENPTMAKEEDRTEG